MARRLFGFSDYSISQFAIIIFVLWIPYYSCQGFSGAELREYCQWELFNASCPADQVILMVAARYGRMRFGRCMREDHGSNGCAAVVLPHLDRKCSARRTCELNIPDAAMHNAHPCPKELMPYLEASYVCLPVKSGSTQSCALHGGLPVSSQGSGYLASLTAIEIGVGSKNCPWVIQAQPGQKVNLTLYSFSVSLENIRESSALQSGQADPSLSRSDLGDLYFERCDWSVVIHEGNATKQISGCAGPAREKLVYTSSGATLKVYTQPSPSIDFSKSPHILLRYQVYGCPDLTGITDAVIERRADTLIVRCLSTGEKYLLNCEKEHWKGEFTNCSKAEPMGPKRYTEDGAIFPYGTGLLLIIGIGVVMGITVGILMLLAIVLYLRRRRVKNFHQSRTEDTLLQKSEYTGSSSHSIYSQQHRRRVDCTGSASTLCPYHHHLKYHMVSPSSELTSPGCFEEGVSVTNLGGSLPVSASVVTSPTAASFPLLAFTSAGTSGTGSVQRSVSMYDKKRGRKQGQEQHQQRNTEGDVDPERVIFICPCPEGGANGCSEHGDVSYSDFPPPPPTASNSLVQSRTTRSTDQLNYERLPTEQTTVLDLIRHSQGTGETKTPRNCNRHQMRVNIV